MVRKKHGLCKIDNPGVQELGNTARPYSIQMQKVGLQETKKGHLADQRRSFAGSANPLTRLFYEKCSQP